MKCVFAMENIKNDNEIYKITKKSYFKTMLTEMQHFWRYQYNTIHASYSLESSHGWSQNFLFLMKEIQRIIFVDNRKCNWFSRYCYETIIRTETTCKIILCYMRDSLCWRCVVKYAKIL